MPRWRSVLTTLSVVPSGSGSSFSTRPPPIPDGSVPVKLLRVGVRSSAWYRDFLRCIFFLTSSSLSEASLLFSAGHSLGKSVWRR